MLLSVKGADLEAEDHCGETALHMAAHVGSLQMVCFLLKAGADASHRDSRGKLPSSKAGGREARAIGELLEVARTDMGRAREIISLLKASRQSRTLASCRREAAWQGEMERKRKKLEEAERRAKEILEVPEGRRSSAVRRELKELALKIARRREWIRRMEAYASARSSGGSSRGSFSWSWFHF